MSDSEDDYQPISPESIKEMKARGYLSEWHRPVEKPTWTFPSPFVAYAALDNEEVVWGPPPRTLAELRMYALSWAIRSKPQWRSKIEDTAILEKWRAEAVDQQQGLLKYKKLNKHMINYVLTELPAYAALADNEHGIEAGPFDAIWYSDSLIPDELTTGLRKAALKLEDVPDAEKDWHPGSNGLVLDLVHPSLYPLLYDRTRALDGIAVKAPTQQSMGFGEPPSNSYGDQYNNIADNCISAQYSWLPSDFAISSDGHARLISPYINNLHPELHRELYPLIEQIVGAFVPMFERVLSQINGEDRDLLRFEQENGLEAPGNGRIQTQLVTISRFVGQANLFYGLAPPCIWAEQSRSIWAGQRLRWPEEFSTDEALCDAIQSFPRAHKKYNGALERSISPYSLRGKTLQCIVKLANIHLTPDKPSYDGGSWHVEGMLNERIVASGIYYYDEDNISESRLAFRATTSSPPYHHQDDVLCSEILYGMFRNSHCVQDLGSIETKSGRALAWPNIYQHRVAPFSLKDTSRPGHRKILAIFLVDPSIPPIPSATTIPPQQADWAAYAMEQAREDEKSLFSKLPVELIHAIRQHMEADCLGRYLGRKEAEEIRLQLMAERTVFVKGREKELSMSFNMCEH
ncbi:hypothetical protein MKEN_00031000 [Mycena kentingensis (nom. inval.)]|nr:hypothetical protein MKEN_00031000 [Mycena kentingensis (nom. inval.)]